MDKQLFRRKLFDNMHQFILFLQQFVFNYNFLIRWLTANHKTQFYQNDYYIFIRSYFILKTVDFEAFKENLQHFIARLDYRRSKSHVRKVITEMFSARSESRRCRGKHEECINVERAGVDLAANVTAGFSRAFPARLPVMPCHHRLCIRCSRL